MCVCVFIKRNAGFFVSPASSHGDTCSRKSSASRPFCVPKTHRTHTMNSEKNTMRSVSGGKKEKQRNNRVTLDPSAVNQDMRRKLETKSPYVLTTAEIKGQRRYLTMQIKASALAQSYNIYNFNSFIKKKKNIIK